ncbi:hypothetical protein AGMMS50230_19280 [Spirochaetia bacterium]|nr:hypothetical protein AGMMS50230_19280 [Spirochaetia bacterium]
MNLRKRCLPPGWYPQNPDKIGEFLASFALKAPDNPALGGLSAPRPAIAAVAPHAGWYYSGAIAAQAVAVLAASASVPPGETGSETRSIHSAPRPVTVAVIGGHLPGTQPPLFALETAAETPLGPLELDGELRDILFRRLKGAEDCGRDNTVEVLLPMVKYFFPAAKLLWMRFPADIRSFDAGKELAKAAVTLGRRLFVLGSTDLTHYGNNYGFTRDFSGNQDSSFSGNRDSGQKALDWVKKVNDARFIEAVEAGDPAVVLDRAEGEKSACSAGAVLGVMGYAAESGAAGSLLAYGTSADITMEEDGGIHSTPRGIHSTPRALPDSFVGYGAFCWR